MGSTLIDVAEELAIEPILDLARRHELAVRPDIGDVFTPKIIDTVGSSMAIGGIGDGFSGSAMVSPMVMSSMPARHTMSPAAFLDVHVSGLRRRTAW